MDIVSQYASVNGLNMHYVTAGDGPPVLLLHGFPDTHVVWRRQIPALAAAGFHVIAPDLRGYGKTDMPGDVDAYAVSFLADDVLRLMDALGFAQATVVGHDWGALIGWHLAMHAPGRVSRYVALSVGHPEAIAHAGLGQQLRFWYMGVFVTPVLAETLLKAGNWAALRAMSTSRQQQQLWIDALAPRGRLTAALNYYRANLGAAGTRRWKPVDVPVLGVWSEHDPALGERQMRETGQHCRAGFQYRRIDGAGHWLQLDQAELLNGLLIDFARSPGRADMPD